MGKHAIIVIKNEEGEYLQYFDKKWNSYLFLNCKLPHGDDSEAVKNKIADDLNIRKDLIKATLIGKKQHRKFSESAKIEKEYIHYFYNVKMDTKLEEKEFLLNNTKYKWFSHFDLEENKRIMQVNGDIIQFIKEFNM